MLAPRRQLHSTPLAVFRRALELVDVQSSDVLYDLGCGDGRCVIEAARSHGIRAVGIEIDATRAALARANAIAAGVGDLVTIRHANAMDVALDDATIVFLFLIDRGLKLVRPRLEQLQRPCRVVTYLYRFAADVRYRARHLVPLDRSVPDAAFPIFLYEFPTTDRTRNAPALTKAPDPTDDSRPEEAPQQQQQQHDEEAEEQQLHEDPPLHSACRRAH